MKASSYLNFDGTAEAAFTRYADVLGGRIEGLFRFGDVPGMAGTGCDPKGVMHIALSLPGGDMLMASDAPKERVERVQGFYISLSLDSVEEVSRIFAALSDGGAVEMPVQETFWSEAFSMFTDRWGTPWMLSGPDKPMGA